LLASLVSAIGYARTPAQVAASFTLEQATNGRRTYMQQCQSCHGINLVDGPSGPNVKGASFRENWFGRTVDMLFQATATMPPAAPGDDKYAELVALMLAENGMPVSDVPLPSSAERLKTVFLPWTPPVPGAELPPGFELPRVPTRPNPLDQLTPVTDAMLANPP